MNLKQLVNCRTVPKRDNYRLQFVKTVLSSYFQTVRTLLRSHIISQFRKLFCATEYAISENVNGDLQVTSVVIKQLRFYCFRLRRMYASLTNTTAGCPRPNVVNRGHVHGRNRTDIFLVLDGVTRMRLNDISNLPDPLNFVDLPEHMDERVGGWEGGWWHRTGLWQFERISTHNCTHGGFVGVTAESTVALELQPRMSNSLHTKFAHDANLKAWNPTEIKSFDPRRCFSEHVCVQKVQNE